MNFRSLSRAVGMVFLTLIAASIGGGQESNAESPTLKVAVVSSHSVFGDVDANLDHFAKLIEEAAKENPRIVCFPELALVSYTTHKDVLKSAEEIPGPTSKKLEAFAKKFDVYISAGMAERDGDKFHIAQIVVGPDGYLGKYRKNFPTGGEQACGFSSGDAYPTWMIDGFRFGVLICADGRQLASIEAMKKAKVDVIHHPHGNTIGRLGREAEEWTRSKMVYFVARAIHARSYILVNNSAEDTEQPDRTLQYSSGALVVDPLGQAVTRTMQTDRSEKMIFATLKKPAELIPPGELRILKSNDPVFKERFKGP